MGLLVGGSVLAIIAVCYVSYVAKKKINSILERKKAEEAARNNEGGDENDEEANLSGEAEAEHGEGPQSEDRKVVPTKGEAEDTPQES